MSERNGDRARFQKNRKRKLLHRQRVHALTAKLRRENAGAAAAATARVEADPARTVNS